MEFSNSYQHLEQNDVSFILIFNFKIFHIDLSSISLEERSSSNLFKSKNLTVYNSFR